MIDVNELTEVALNLCNGLECDGSTRVLSHFLRQKGISHKTILGNINEKDIKNNGEIINSFYPHYWIEIDGDEDTLIIDFKAKMWLGETAPNGFISKSKINSKESEWIYDGKEVSLNKSMNRVLYEVQLNRN